MFLSWVFGECWWVHKSSVSNVAHGNDVKKHTFFGGPHKNDSNIWSLCLGPSIYGHPYILLLCIVPHSPNLSLIVYRSYPAYPHVQLEDQPPGGQKPKPLNP